MNKYDVMIIGAGPAGLLAASECARAGLKTILLESQPKAGRKLLITGSGKCNITNSLAMDDFINRYGDKSRFVRNCLYSFSNNDLIEFFEKNGLTLKIKSNGCVYPESERASDVLKCLMNMCKKSDILIKYNTKINSVSFHDGLFKASPGISSDSCSANASESPNTSGNLNVTASEYRSRFMIIAAGGFTWPSTGSDGSGYRLAKALGHSIVEPRLALTSVTACDEDYKHLKDCSGISIECGIKQYRVSSENPDRKGSYTGSLLFTQTGLSGPVILNSSRYFCTGDILKLNFFPGLGKDELNRKIINFCSTNGKSMVKSFFTSGGLPERLVKAVFTSAGCALETEIRAAELASELRKKLSTAFTALPIKIKSLEGREKAYCTAGGVDTSEINPKTMESKIIPNLYFAGEVIDVDGDSGGFNLQFAFSSAKAAAETISASALLPDRSHED